MLEWKTLQCNRSCATQTQGVRAPRRFCASVTWSRAPVSFCEREDERPGPGASGGGPSVTPHRHELHGLHRRETSGVYFFPRAPDFALKTSFRAHKRENGALNEREVT